MIFKLVLKVVIFLLKKIEYQFEILVIFREYEIDFNFSHREKKYRYVILHMLNTLERAHHIVYVKPFYDNVIEKFFMVFRKCHIFLKYKEVDTVFTTLVNYGKLH